MVKRAQNHIPVKVYLLIVALASAASSKMLTDLAREGLIYSSDSELEETYFKGGKGLNINKDICPDSLFGDILKDLPNKYPWEVHHLTTDDSYILRLFRIQAKGTNITPGKKVVFLQHGLIDSADDWIINTEDYSLGLVLANAGYDVWLGNSRGNKYSLDTVKPMKEKEYWDFSFQQMAWYDVPANIKYVLSVTGQDTLSYVGHS